MSALTPVEIEQLVCVAEEAAEVVQAVTKILRFGWESTLNHGIAYSNRHDLEKELGDLRGMVAILMQAGSISSSAYQFHAVEKLKDVQEYLQHQENIVLAVQVLEIHNGHG